MLACIVLAFSLGIAGAAEWGYPEDAHHGWDGACIDGMNQSPIDLDSNMTATIHSPITFKNYFNGPFNKYIKGMLEFNGHSIVWFPNQKSKAHMLGGKNWKYKCPSIRDGPYGGVEHSHAYFLWQLHFHWGSVGDVTKGSEHTVDGMSYPLEMHMVHVEDQFIAADGTIDAGSAVADPKGLAVLGIFFKVDPSKPQNQEPLETIDDEAWKFHHHIGGHPKEMRSAEELEDAELEHYHDLNMRSLMSGMHNLNAKQKKRDAEPKAREHSSKLNLNVGAFLRKATNNGADKTMSTYWTYKGSLTTPTCNEAVTWVVFDRALPIAQVQANSFSSIIQDNFRPARAAAPEHNVQFLIHNAIGK